MDFDTVANLSLALATQPGRNARVDALAALLSATPPRCVATLAHWLSGELRQGRVGLGWAAIQDAVTGLEGVPRGAPLSVEDVDRAWDDIAAARGAGAVKAKRERLLGVLSRASAAGRRFLLGLVSGELRQGAQEGLLLTAVARAYGVPEAEVRRAAMLSGSLPEVAAALGAASHEGRPGSEALTAFTLTLMRPLAPMLADTAEDLAALAEVLALHTVEPKLDGARVQIHRDGAAVAIFSRALNEVTQSLPEVVEAVSSLPVTTLVADGEVLALRGDRPLPFQTTMRRFGRKLDVAEARAELPLTTYLFDILHVDGETLIDRPLAERRRALEGLFSNAPGGLPLHLAPTLSGPTLPEAERFLAETLAAGHEGVMVKRLASPYEAGHRGKSWLKVKPAKTLDLVVIAVEQGSGRRSQWLSNLHLAAREDTPDGPRWVMLGKTFKGMTDELLRWQTAELSARMTSREGHVVHVRPELVVEIAFQELETSPRYPGGLALRFARVKGYRHDKGPREADTMDTVRALHVRQLGDP